MSEKIPDVTLENWVTEPPTQVVLSYERYRTFISDKIAVNEIADICRYSALFSEAVLDFEKEIFALTIEYASKQHDIYQTFSEALARSNLRLLTILTAAMSYFEYSKSYPCTNTLTADLCNNIAELKRGYEEEAGQDGFHFRFWQLLRNASKQCSLPIARAHFSIGTGHQHSSDAQSINLMLSINKAELLALRTDPKNSRNEKTKSEIRERSAEGYDIALLVRCYARILLDIHKRSMTRCERDISDVVSRLEEILEQFPRGLNDALITDGEETWSRNAIEHQICTIQASKYRYCSENRIVHTAANLTISARLRE